MQLQRDLLRAWEKLINLSTIDELKDWIKDQGGGEGPQLELKQQRKGEGKKEDPLPKAVCALANSDGGIIIVGVIDPSKWGPNVIIPQKEEKQSIRDEIRDAFVHRRPEVAVEFNEDLEITVILVKGNNPEPLLIKTPDKLIGGYRRKGDSSDSFRPEEVVAYCSGWKHQFDEILRRYDALSDDLDFKSTHCVPTGISRFFVNALPIQILTKRTFIEGEVSIPRNSSPISWTFSVEGSTTTGSHTCVRAQASWDDTKSISISAIGSGSYVVQVDAGRKTSDFLLNAKACIVGLYTAFALSNLRDSAVNWSIQGFYSVNHSTLVVSHDPILFQAPLKASSPPTFPSIEANLNISEDTCEILADIIKLLGFEPEQIGLRPGHELEFLDYLVKYPFG
jgi:hypothetical protein